MDSSSKELGLKGEKFAAEYLLGKGYEILDRNYRYGRMGEIDIIARKGDTIVFVEVRTRLSMYVSPLETITKGKQRKVARIAEIYLDVHNIRDTYGRLDVISVSVEGEDYTIEHIEDAFRHERHI